MYPELDLKQAHQHSSHHRAEISRSNVCGCFYCLGTFAPSTINEWVADGVTAVCPQCGIDAVLGDASGLNVADTGFMTAMKEYWF